MSVVEGKNPTSLRMKFDLGFDSVTNKTKVRSKTYSNVRHNATSQDIYDVAIKLQALQKHEVIEICKIENTTLA